MKIKNLTMKDVADKARVSITTVSHVINETRHVNQETRDAVLQAINTLNYPIIKNSRPVSGKHIKIGVVIADIREDYFISFLKVIETEAADLNISIIFCDSEVDPEKEEKNIGLLLEQKVSGLILAPVESEYIPAALKTAAVPVVLIDRQYESHQFLFVGINNIKSSYEGTKYLYTKGCKNPGIIGYGGSVYTIKQRMLGFQTYMHETHQSALSNQLLLNHHENFPPLIKDFIRKNELDGIFCATPTLCYEVIDTLESLEPRIRENLKIISYDDNRWFDFLKYPVSIISQPLAEIGNAVLENLLQMIEQPNSAYSVRRELLFDTSIIDRLK